MSPCNLRIPDGCSRTPSLCSKLSLIDLRLCQRAGLDTLLEEMVDIEEGVGVEEVHILEDVDV